MRKPTFFLAAVFSVLFAEKALCHATTFSIASESFNSLRYQDIRVEEAAPLSIRTGRFLNVDPVLDVKKTMPTPQMWNRYAYGLNNPLTLLDPDGRAVKSYQLLTTGPNNVPISKYHGGLADTTTLGLQTTPIGFFVASNVKIELDEGDDLSKYKVERDAVIKSPRPEVRTGRKENPDDGQLARAGHNIFVFDSPGLTATNEGGTSTSRTRMGSGVYQVFFKVQVVDRETKKVDPQRFYYAMQISYTNGTPDRTTLLVTKISEADYKDHTGRQ